METTRNRAEVKNQGIKEDLIKRSLDIFSGTLSEEERKKILSLDRKTREKYLYKAMTEGLAPKNKGVIKT
jgi:diketogulonate reductase-like aldo/keto reductase